jgi:outer membrane protein insertion porin family
VFGAALILLAALAAGEPIRSVDVQAPGSARYARYLGLAAGDTYDPERVREAVLRLFATGDFEDVVVTAEVGEGGLALVFRTKTSPRLRTALVRGDRRISADTLLRHARLRKGEALWPARLEAAARDATTGLVADGYLDASVQAEALPLVDGAELVFTVQAGPRVRLRFAQVAGFVGPPPLQDLLRPHHGDVFRRARAEQAAERMRERLAQAGYWRAEVELEEIRAPGSRSVDLVFNVRPGPALSLDVNGIELPRGRRRAITSILRDGAARPDALEAGAESIEEHLRAEGYREPLVRHHVEPSPGGERIVYDVTPGTPATVAGVEVRGARELAALVETRTGMPLRDDLVAEDVRALRDALRERGHVDARVEAVVRDGGGHLPVVFRVEPGLATLVERITVEASLPPGEEVTTELLLRAGQPYRVRALAADRSRVTTAYRNAGYLDAEVEPKILFSEDRTRAEVTLQVAPGSRLEVGQVLVTGLERTQEEVVLREVPLERGRALSLEKLLEGQRRLSALGLFERVSLTPLDGERGTRDVLVSLSESPVTTIAYGLGYSERDLFRGSVEVTRRNLFGLDRSLTAFGRVAFRGQRFVLSYREPFFLGRRRDFFGTAFFDDEDRTTFDFTRLGGIAQTTRRFGDTRAVILRLTYQETDVFNVEVPLEEIDRQFRTYTLAGPSASVVLDNRDNPLDARAGHFLSADLLFSLRVLGGAQFAKSFVQAAHYTRLRRELTLAVSARVGLAATFGESVPDELPLPERFFAGGDYTIRGFEIDTAGPLEVGTNGELFPTGGNGLLLGSAELRRDIGRALTLAAFFDLGNVYSLVSEISLSDVRYTTGLGLRYRTPLGPVRLDWGVKLNPRPGESGYRFHLTVGNAY